MPGDLLLVLLVLLGVYFVDLWYTQHMWYVVCTCTVGIVCAVVSV